jgi:hypothetical protein
MDQNRFLQQNNSAMQGAAQGAHPQGLSPDMQARSMHNPEVYHQGEQ